MKLTKKYIREKLRKEMKTTLGTRYLFSYKGRRYVAFGNNELEAIDAFYKRLK